MSVRSLNGLSSVFVNTIQAGDAINVSSSGTSISTINVDISKQSAKTSISSTDLFLLEESDGSIKKITGNNLINSNSFWTYSSPSLRPDNITDNVLIGTTTNTDSRKLIVFGDSELGDVYMPTDKKLISKNNSNDFVKFGNGVLTMNYTGGTLISGGNVVFGSSSDLILSAGGVGISRAGSSTDKIYFNSGNFTFGNTGIFNNSVQVKSTNSSEAGSITFFEASDNQTNTLKLIAPSSMSDCILNLPSFTGTDTLALSSSVPDLTTALNFATSQSSNYTIGAGGTNKNFTNFNSIRGFEIEIGDIPQDTTAPYTDTTTKGCSRIDIQCRTGSNDDTINILASPVWNQGINSTINITASSRSGVLASGASNINITANDISLPNSNGCRITLSALTEVVINTGFKINSTGTITAVGSKITNGFIDTGIADNKLVEIDSSTVATNDYARFTSVGLEGRSYSEVASDIGSSITTVGTITTGVWNGSAIAAIYGGTGIQTYTTGDILYGSATNTLSKLAIGSNNTFLMSNGSIPVWSAGLSFTSPLNKSGTTIDLGNLSGFGTNNQILATNGSDALEYRTLTEGSNITITNTSSAITINSVNYWERNSNVSTFDIKTTNTVDNIVLTVPLSTNTTFVSTSSIKSTLGLISGGGEYIKFEDYSGTKPLGIKGIINSSTQRTYHFEFTHDSTGSAYPLLGQDINGNLFFHWNGQGDKFTFKSNGDSLMSGIISPTSSNEECFLAFGSTVLTNTFHRNQFVKLTIAKNTSYAAGTEPGYIELIESATGGTSSNTTRLYFNQAGNASIFWDGNNLINTPAFAPSDERLKKNETLANTTELSIAFDNIEIYKYQYEEQYAIEKGADPNKYVYGFIAQNVKENTDNLSSQFSSVGKGQAIYPNDKIDYEGDKLEVDNVLTINKTDMNLLLWGKIKEMDAIIKNQQIVINNLLSATTFANFKKMNIN